MYKYMCVYDYRVVQTLKDAPFILTLASQLKTCLLEVYPMQRALKQAH